MSNLSYDVGGLISRMRDVQNKTLAQSFWLPGEPTSSDDIEGLHRLATEMLRTNSPFWGVVGYIVAQYRLPEEEVVALVEMAAADIHAEATSEYNQVSNV